MHVRLKKSIENYRAREHLRRSDAIASIFPNSIFHERKAALSEFLSADNYQMSCNLKSFAKPEYLKHAKLRNLNSSTDNDI